MTSQIRLRPTWIPYAWRCVSPGISLKSFARLRDYKLVLEARGVPFLIWRSRDRAYFFAPPLVEKLALAELAAYREELSRPRRKTVAPPVYKNAPRACLWLLPITFFYNISGSSFLSALPPPDQLNRLGSLSYNDVVFRSQFYRAITALTLHVDISHLSGNMFFGAIFLIMLARAIGWGSSFLWTILAGSLANLASVYFRSPRYASVGFSTAVFASLGLLAGTMIRRVDDPRKTFVSLASAIALLALLGTEGERSDYGAHIAGLAAGLILGFIRGDKPSRLPQLASGIIGLSLIALAWTLALM